MGLTLNDVAGDRRTPSSCLERVVCRGTFSPLLGEGVPEDDFTGRVETRDPGPESRRPSVRPSVRRIEGRWGRGATGLPLPCRTGSEGLNGVGTGETGEGK